MIRPKSFNAGSETLSGVLVSADSQQKPTNLFLHGAGKGTKKRALPIATYLEEHCDQASFLFDFSGHGESTGMLEHSSLAKRVSEAQAALQFFDTDKPFNLLGFSMGGHIALELLKDYPVANLVLFYPGIYTKDAYELQFDQGFSEVIRQHESWRDTAVTENLKGFTGRFLIVIGENDDVIPDAVIDMIYATAKDAHRKEILRIPNATHMFLEPTLQNPVAGPILCQKVAEYLTGDY
jgi:pimeloyl-ACP methyl ester carboxylesterase